MLWHEMQNLVCSERCMCMDMPASMHSAGRMQRATNARILPVIPTVIEVRNRNTAASTIVSTINATRIPVAPVTTPPDHASARIIWQCVDRTAERSSFLRQSANVRDEIFNLRIFQTASEGGHFALPLGRDRDELFIGFLLYFGGSEIAHPQLFADRCVPLTIRAVARGALRLVKHRRVLSVQRSDEQEKGPQSWYGISKHPN